MRRGRTWIRGEDTFAFSDGLFRVALLQVSSGRPELRRFLLPRRGALSPQRDIPGQNQREE
jgi:hypothetical protein